MNPFLNFPVSPLDSDAIENAIFGPLKHLECHFFDTMHNITNMVSMHLEALKDAMLNRFVLQGNPILIYKVEKKEYRYVEFFSISSEQSSGECVASKFHSALKIAATSVARSFKTANDSSKSDQARAAAFDRKPGGKHAAKVF